MVHANGGGEIERGGQLPNNANGFRRRHVSALAGDSIEGIGGHEILGEVRGNSGDTCSNRRGNRGVRQIGLHQEVELGAEPVDLIWGHVEIEALHSHEPVDIWLVGPEHRSERAGADLMENPERPERVRKRRAGIVRVQ
jgi:hypothetical protein